MTPLIKDGSRLPQSYILLQYVLDFNLKVASTTLIDVSRKLLNEEEVYEAAINSSLRVREVQLPSSLPLLVLILLLVKVFIEILDKS